MHGFIFFNHNDTHIHLKKEGDRGTGLCFSYRQCLLHSRCSDSHRSSLFTSTSPRRPQVHGGPAPQEGIGDLGTQVELEGLPFLKSLCMLLAAIPLYEQGSMSPASGKANYRSVYISRISLFPLWNNIMQESKGMIDIGKSGYFGRLTGDTILTRFLQLP